MAYDTDLAKCVELLQKLFSADAYVLNGAELPIYVSSMGESSIRIYVRAQVERSKYNEAQNHLYIKVKNAFDEAGIKFHFLSWLFTMPGIDCRVKLSDEKFDVFAVFIKCLTINFIDT